MEGLIFGILRYCNFEDNTDEIRQTTLFLWRWRCVTGQRTAVLETYA